MLTWSPVKVAVLCSRRAPGLLHLLTRALGRGVGWEIVCCVTSEETFEEEGRVIRQGVPVIRHPVRRFYFEREPDARLGDLALRAEYDAATLETLRPYNPDVVLLAGYLLLLTTPMLAAFPDRIFNVHHSDLLLRIADGRPRYPGLRAVRDAIMAGERETRSTVHVVTPDLDGGPPLLRSWPFRVPQVAEWALAGNARDVLRPVIWAHQEWMLRSSFGPLLARTLDLYAAGTLDGTVRDFALEVPARPPVFA